MNTTRQAVLAAGFPESVPATTVDRQCGSSQQAVHFAAQAVQSGAQDVVLACGVESMSRVPMWSNWLDQDPYGALLARRYTEGLVPQGVSAELVVAQHGLSRQDLDEYAIQSQQRAAQAAAAGWFAAELVAVNTVAVDGSPVKLEADETIRAEPSREGLASLKSAFYDPVMAARFPQLSWQVTAGNSSPLTDGASCALIVSERAANRLGLQPRARVHRMAVVGADPLTMLLGVLPATRKVLEGASMSVDDIDAFEVNEAFACVPLAWQQTFRVPDDRLNSVGGAIALGHPLGASGVRVLATLLGVLERGSSRYGLQTICEAGGMANAMIIERL